MLTAEDDGWRIAPTRVRFGGGRGTLSGKTGSNPKIQAQLQAMPLQLLDIGWPGLGLSGTASGRLDYRWNGAGGRPSGRADLRVRGLSRSGLVLSSKPIDLGLAAVIDNGKAAFKSAKAALRRAKVDFTEKLLVGDPAHAIVKFIKTSRCDHLVMGSHGRGAFKNLVLGSVATKVLSQSDVPVTIVR